MSKHVDQEGTPFMLSPVGGGGLYGLRLSENDLAATSLPIPFTLGGTRAVMGGRSMPTLFAGQTQLNVQVPY